MERDTDTALGYLTAYLLVDDRGKPAYSGSRFERLGEAEISPNAFTAADLLAPSLLSAELTGHTIARLLGREAPAATRLLEQISPTLEIVHATDDQLDSDSPAGQLWALVRGRDQRDGAGPTTTSKVLARKRPLLLPIWDSFIEKATGLDTTNYWIEVRDALKEGSESGSVWEWLGDVQRQQPRAHHLSRLRVLDIILWMFVEAPKAAG